MKRIGIVLSIILVLGLAVQVSYVTNSFPGFHGGAECSLCHNDPATSWNSSYADETLTLDGIGDEEFWDGDMTWGRMMYIPIAYLPSYMPDHVHMFVRVIFAQNSSHFFILADWEDSTAINGTDTDKYDPADGISFMFNINAEKFETCFSGSMTTANEGEKVDMITWKAASSAEGTEPDIVAGETVSVGQGVTTDWFMDDRGIAADDSSDWQVAAIYGNISAHHEENYQVELVRPLVTGDSDDVQFDESGYYEFAIAIYNDNGGVEHISSFGHSVFVYNGEPSPETVTVTETEQSTVTTTKSDAALFGVFGMAVIAMFSVAAIVINRRKP